MNLLGRLLAFLAEPEAIEIQREALAMRRRLFGREHVLVAESHASVGFAIWQADARRVEESERIYREALDMYRRLGQADHPDMGRFTFGHAVMLWQMDRPAEAEAAFQSALDVFRRLESRSDRDMVECLNRFAQFLIDRQRDAEAEGLLRESLSLTPQKSGLAGLVRPNRLLAVIHLRRGDTEAAIRLHAGALAIRLKELTRQFPETADTIERHVQLLDELTGTDEAVAALEDALVFVTEWMPLSRTAWEAWIMDVAECFDAHGRHAEASSLARRCLDNLEKDLPPDSERVQRARRLIETAQSNPTQPGWNNP